MKTTKIKISKIKCKPVTFGTSDKKGKEKYIRFREIIRKKTANKTRQFKNEVSVKIKLYITSVKASRSDLDNYLKTIIDGLTNFKGKNKRVKIGLIEKEKQIGLIEIKRIIDEKEGVEIEIY